MTLVLPILAVFCLSVGVCVLWANPNRFTNQLFATVSLLIATWIYCIYHAVGAELLVASGRYADPEPWFRSNAAVIAFFPWVLALITESIISASLERSRSVRRSLPFLCVSIALCSLAYADSFVLRAADGDHQRGQAYNLYTAAGAVAYLVLITRAYRHTRVQLGIRRVEVQFLALNLCIAGLVGVVSTGLANILHIWALKWASILFLTGTYALTAWAVTYHRVFDVRQVFVSIGQRSGVIITSAMLFIVMVRIFDPFVPSRVCIGASFIVCILFSLWLDRRSRRWLRIDGEHATSHFRNALIEIARMEPSADGLVARFEKLLRERCQCEEANLLFNPSDGVPSNFEFLPDRPDHSFLCEMGWATPEALQRRRQRSSSAELQQFFQKHSLGLMVAAPRGSPTPSLVIALGVKTTQWPYTYPEVLRIQNIAELMDNILTRSRLTTQEAMKAKTEHLAMMSRGLAHDLKNLLTPVSSFLIHTEGRFPEESAEAEVHTAAQRSIRIMGDYVSEARFFADRLAPRWEPCGIRAICKAAHEIVISRAETRGVAVELRIETDKTLTVDSVLMQRMLGNLLANAIDASVAGTQVTLSASFDSHVTLQVADQGCGIAPENLSRIFEPYFTTKEFGNDVRGFGLGLTICQKIAALHEGTISVRSEPGHGTTFTIKLPDHSLQTSGNATPPATASAPRPYFQTTP